MHATDEKGDIKSTKTERAMNDALSALLWKRNFRRITVRDICEESLLSRATFYTRFTDKYSYLRWWMNGVWPYHILREDAAYDVKAQKINEFVEKNKTIIKNLFVDADRWTLEVIYDMLHSLLYLTAPNTTEDTMDPKRVVLSTFYAGGMMRYVMWQINNDFPQDVRTMNIYIYKTIQMFRE